jgi:hypothetical protein
MSEGVSADHSQPGDPRDRKSAPAKQYGVTNTIPLLDPSIVH